MNKYDKGSSEKLFNEGVELYEQEKISEAEQKFLAALELQPASEEILYNLALVYFEQKKYDLCWNIADRIHHIDCTELFKALEDAGYEPHYEIPEDIPETCAECMHFRSGSMLRDEGGFCSFFHMHVDSLSRCYVYRLVDEGKVAVESIQQNQNKRLNNALCLYAESLLDELLPESVTCENCATKNKLSQTDRITKQFTCQNCASLNDIHTKINEQQEKLCNFIDQDLFDILIFPDEYKPEFLLAARKEINRRNLNLETNEQFKQFLKQNINNLS